MPHYDISLTLSSDLPIWPGDPPLQINQIASLDQGDPANVSSLSCCVHIGTHIDAPRHFLADGRTTDAIPLSELIVPVTVVEFPAVSVIDEAVLEGAPIQPDANRLLFKTRNSLRWQQGDSKFFEDFVAIDESGANWLVEHDIRMVGVDYLSVAPWQAPAPTHEILLESGVVIIEGLDLHEVEPAEYKLICLPLKLAGVEGAPARAILVEPD